MWETMKVFSKWANLKYVNIFQKKKISKESLVVDNYIFTESAKG